MQRSGRPALQLDDNLKNLLRELGHATIGLAKRDAASGEEGASKLTTQDRRFLESLRIQVDQESFDQDPDRKAVARLTMTPQDVRFLKSLRIATDNIE